MNKYPTVRARTNRYKNSFILYDVWRNEITANKGDTKKLWRTMQGLLGETSTDENGVYAADDFAAFFKDKVDAVRTPTAATPSYDVPFKATTSTLCMLEAGLPSLSTK